MNTLDKRYEEIDRYRRRANLWLVVFLVVGFLAAIFGCTPEVRNYKPLIAASVGVCDLAHLDPVDPKPKPEPEPGPEPSPLCDNCNGTGKLGDGTIEVDCPVCGGDGYLSEVERAVKAMGDTLREEVRGDMQECVDVSAVLTRLDALETRIVSLERKVLYAASSPPVDLSALEARLSQIEERMRDAAPAFQTDYARAQAIARKYGKPLLVTYSSKTCGPCRKLTYYQTANLEFLVDAAVLCRIYVQDDPELVAQAKVKVFPTQVIEIDGVEKFRHAGLHSGSYREWIEEKLNDL